MESGGLFSRGIQEHSTLEPVNNTMQWEEPIEERAPIPVRQEKLLDHLDHDDLFMNAMDGMNGMNYY